MASGQVAQAVSRRAKAQARASKNNTTDKWIGKKFTVEAGDIVQFHTASNHMTGGLGKVVGYLDKNTILIETFGGNDTDFPPMHISIRNQKANPNYQGRDFNAHYQNHITKVLHRVNPKPKKKRKPVQFYEVTPQVLPAVLSGEHKVPAGHKVVLVDDRPAVVDLHAVQTPEVTP